MTPWSVILQAIAISIKEAEDWPTLSNPLKTEGPSLHSAHCFVKPHFLAAFERSSKSESDYSRPPESSAAVSEGPLCAWDI
jgi:hypothetical protein